MSVRRVLEQRPDGRLLFGDVVGDLVALGAQTAVLETRDGLVEIPLPLVALARVAAPSTADDLALEAVAAAGLRPAESAALGGWTLRADHGLTQRANSVLPLRSPGRPLDEQLALAQAWYAERELPLRIQVPVEARRLLDAELGERGWDFRAQTHVLAARLDRLRSRIEPDLPDVGLASEPDDEWLGLYRGAAAATPTGRALLTRHDHVAFASLRLSGRTVAVARGALDDGWLGVMAVEVDPAHRRRGLGAAVTAALVAWATARGATRSYLQVSGGNTGALALYEGLGYWRHHDYRYRTAPDPR